MLRPSPARTRATGIGSRTRSHRRTRRPRAPAARSPGASSRRAALDGQRRPDATVAARTSSMEMITPGGGRARLSLVAARADGIGDEPVTAKPPLGRQALVAEPLPLLRRRGAERFAQQPAP